MKRALLAAAALLLPVAGIGAEGTAPKAQPKAPAAIPAGFRQQPTFAGQRPSPEYVLARFDDGYVWLVKDTITGVDKRGTYEGKAMHVAHGAFATYTHILGTTLVREDPIPGAVRVQGIPTDREFRQQATYPGQRPSPEFVLVRFDDGYVWLVKDAVTAIDKRGAYQGKPMHVAHGARGDYYHVLGTTLVRQVAR